ncbi:MAG: M23 family metallopeptidase, partial [Deltaproteobacteria bacterium]|nr:M23 family metallopeptidase [Deltaproteobacteria bacterium]
TQDLRERGQRYEKERVQVLDHIGELESLVNQNEQLVARLETMVGVHSLEGVQVGIGGEAGRRPSVFQLASLDKAAAQKTEADLFDETELRAYNLRTIDLTEEAKDVQQRLKDVYHFNGEAEYFWSSLPTVVPVRGWVTSDFGLRRSPLTGRRQLHEGMDVASPYGAPVVATGDGVVTFSGRGGGLGQKIVIDHGYGLATVYGHNSGLMVKEGDRVRRGQIIASVGSSGRSTGPHLHYEVLVGGVPVDPKRFMLEQL